MHAGVACCWSRWRPRIGTHLRARAITPCRPYLLCGAHAATATLGLPAIFMCHSLISILPFLARASSYQHHHAVSLLLLPYLLPHCPLYALEGPPHLSPFLVVSWIDKPRVRFRRQCPFSPYGRNHHLSAPAAQSAGDVRRRWLLPCAIYPILPASRYYDLAPRLDLLQTFRWYSCWSSITRCPVPLSCDEHAFTLNAFHISDLSPQYAARGTV